MTTSKIYFRVEDIYAVSEKMRAISKEYEQLFIDFGSQVFMEIIDLEDYSEVVSTCLQRIESVLPVFGQHFPDNIPIMCKKGCYHCCLFPITSPPQVILDIARYLQQTMSADELDLLKKKLVLDKQKRQEPLMRAICPFLDFDGGKTCLIYERRPLSCRSFTSPDVTLCEQSVHDGRNIPQQQIRHRIFQIVTTVLLGAAKKKGMFHEQAALIPSLLEIIDKSGEKRSWKGYPI